MKQVLDCGCYYTDPHLTLCPTHNKPLIFGFGSALYGEGKPMPTPEDWKWEKVEGPGLVTEHTLKGPDVLCRCWGDNPPTAHARLIAAAPALLKACKASHKLAVGMGKLAVAVAGQGQMFSPGVVKDQASQFIRATKQAIAQAEKEAT